MTKTKLNENELKLVEYKIAHPLVSPEHLFQKFGFSRAQISNIFYTARKFGYKVPYERTRKAYGMFLAVQEETNKDFVFGKQEPETNTTVKLPEAHQNFKFNTHTNLNYIFNK